MAAEASVWRRRLAVSATFAAVTLLVAGIVVYAFTPGGRDFASVASVKIGGPFPLTTQSGEKLSDTDLKGKPFAVFFGFTHCPEVCPTTLWEMSEALKSLGPEADRLKVLFISVDPTRDDAEALGLYLQSFDPRIVGLTGSEEEIVTVAKSYLAYWRKVPTEDGDYTMDHTASIYLMDAAGEFTGTISYDEQADMRLAKLRKLLAGGRIMSGCHPLSFPALRHWRDGPAATVNPNPIKHEADPSKPCRRGMPVHTKEKTHVEETLSCNSRPRNGGAACVRSCHARKERSAGRLDL